MTDEQTPPDWVLIEAAKRSSWDAWLADELLASYQRSDMFRAICDMIQKHEQPPVDPLVEALADTYGASLVDADELRAALEARGLEIREKGE